VHESRKKESKDTRQTSQGKLVNLFIVNMNNPPLSDPDFPYQGYLGIWMDSLSDVFSKNPLALNKFVDRIPKVGD
jgi:hypothetical protein